MKCVLNNNNNNNKKKKKNNNNNILKRIQSTASLLHNTIIENISVQLMGSPQEHLLFTNGRSYQTQHVHTPVKEM
jgi:hypothetical protein